MSSRMVRTNQVDYISWLYGDYRKNLVREITFQVTSNCNLCCDYCYEHHKSKERMSFETGEHIIDFIINSWEKDDKTQNINKDVKTLIFTFIGGEPFIEVDLIDHICQYFFEQCALRHCPLNEGLLLGITTNGINYFSPKVQKFIEKYKHFLNVTISIDGIKELHDGHRVFVNGKGSYDKAIAAFNANKQYGRQHTKMTFVPSSFKYIYDSIKFMLDNDVEYIACNYAYEPVYTDQDARELYLQLKKVSDYIIETKNNTPITILSYTVGNPIPESDNRNYCGGTGELICFAPDGTAYPCIRYAPISLGTEKSKPMIIGDYNGVYQTDKAKELQKELNSITRISQSSDKCIHCPIASGCGWCSGYNYEVTGSVNKRVTNICRAHFGRTLSSCYFWNKQYIVNCIGQPKKINLDYNDISGILSKDEFDELKALEEKAFKLEQDIDDEQFRELHSTTF